jgi:hypothetical protein
MRRHTLDYNGLWITGNEGLRAKGIQMLSHTNGTFSGTVFSVFLQEIFVERTSSGLNSPCFLYRQFQRREPMECHGLTTGVVAKPREMYYSFIPAAWQPRCLGAPYQV